MAKVDQIVNKKNLDQTAKQFFEFSMERFKEAGLRMTQQRITIIDLLSRHTRPLSALAIAKKITQTSHYESMDQVSVYRILETLKELKLIHQVFPEGGFLACHHAACSTPTHLLMTCNTCQSVKEVGVPPEHTRSMQNYLKDNFNFSAQTHPLQIMGTCESCL